MEFYTSTSRDIFFLIVVSDEKTKIWKKKIKDNLIFITKIDNQLENIWIDF